MLRATTVRRRDELADAPVLDTLTLDRAGRHRRRIALKTDNGREVLLDLAEATYLADGDALVVDGGLIGIRAAVEELYEIHAHDILSLARIAWHLGNRHTPCEITPQAIYIAPDHVLAEMVAGIGGHVHRVLRPFEPEGGAYGGHGPLSKGHHHHHGEDDHGHGGTGHTHG